MVRDVYVIAGHLDGNNILPDQDYWSISFPIGGDGRWVEVRVSRETGKVSSGLTEPWHEPKRH
jgi:hypothetical protein